MVDEQCAGLGSENILIHYSRGRLYTIKRVTDMSHGSSSTAYDERLFALFCLTACIAFVGFLIACNRSHSGPPDYSKLRQQMVKTQIAARGIKDKRVLEAMREVPRHRFVPEDKRFLAYEDFPLSIGHDQTISQPYIVALMTELLELEGKERVLEIGTGSGYQAAILAELAKEVYTIEIVEPLAERSKKILKELGYTHAHVRHGDGYRGWPDAAPFDAIIITAAPEHVPEPLIEQLKVDGIMVLPVGSYQQELIRIRKTEEGTTTEEVLPVRFVPMTGEAQNKKPSNK